MTSQPPHQGVSVEDEEWEAFVHSGFAFSGAYSNKTKIHVNTFIPLDRITKIPK